MLNGPDVQLATPEGRYLRFGVREHAMAALCNGMAAYGGVIPYCATFLNFAGYALGAIRLSALSKPVPHQTAPPHSLSLVYALPFLLHPLYRRMTRVTYHTCHYH